MEESGNTENSNVDRVMDSNVSLMGHEDDDLEVPDEKVGDEIVEEPKVGMNFSSEEEVRSYYTKYAKQVGFGVSKRISRPRDDGKLRYFTLACVRQGTTKSTSYNILRPRPIERMGCKAKVNATLCLDGRNTLSTVVLEHTHALSPGKSRFFRCNKKMNPLVKRRLELNDRAGIRLSKNFKSFVVEAGSFENLSFGEKYCRNYIDKARQLRLGEGGAEALRNYFIRMQQKNDRFYYLMDVDDDCRLRNVFWADARSRTAYESFGDVITFDTTYLTNAYRMPFAPFVGVNHHGQSILFGCGLISNEDTNTFVWLFELWLKCMNDQAPNAIITDQDKAMQNAIAKVFPISRHRFCLCHIMKKLLEKFGSHPQYEAIKDWLQNCIYDSSSCDEFEDSWESLLETYNLRDNVWLDWLYNERCRWVPVYVKNKFWAGMSTTQRSESMNAFFDDYVNSKTTLKQFVEQYDNALRRKVENENTADFSSFHTDIPCITHYSIEKQLQALYTHAKFKEFQEEFRGFIYCRLSLIKREGAVYSYKVDDEVKVSDRFVKRVNFLVSFNDNDFDVKCTCCLFEFRGILCRHAMCVLTMLDKNLLPSKYILDRWRKNLKRIYNFVNNSYDDLNSNPEAQRYEKLTNSFCEIAVSASKSEENCMKLMTHLDLLSGEFVHHGKEFSSRTPSHHLFDASLGISMGSNKKVLSPLVVRSKERPPSRRKMSAVEKAVKTIKTKNRQKQEYSSQPWSRAISYLSTPSTAQSMQDGGMVISQDVDLNIHWSTGFESQSSEFLPEPRK